MRRVLGFLCASGLVALSIAGFGQDTSKKAEPATGSVSGQVSCADTNAPARFALVTLERVPLPKSEAGDKEKREAGVHESAMNATATTDLEGRFVLEKVAVGRYYVLGQLAGYLNPLGRFDEKQLHEMSEETRKELAKVVPIVDVEAGQAATVNLRLEHAAEVAGTVLYDDGSPAVGLHVGLLRKNKNGNLVVVNMELVAGLGHFGSSGMTDDRGYYRMIGTPPGEYALQASLPTEKISVGSVLDPGGTSISISNQEGGELSVYSGNVFRKKDAKITKVGEGDQDGGVDITIPLAGLHAVRGTVTAKLDGHPLNKGTVELLYADDDEAVRSAPVQDDGGFVFSYVPEGKYVLRLSGGADAEKVEIHPYPDMTVKQDKVLKKYAATEMPLLVQGDVSGVELAAPDLPADKVAQQQ